MRSILIGVAAAVVALSTWAGPARADWRKAESDRFIVYSDGDETVLRGYVQKLETFDRVLRTFMGLPLESPTARPLPIYLVANHDALARVWPKAPEQMAGFYARSDQDIFAVAIRRRGDDQTLLHEYAHHFMLQHFSYGYPAWFVEGFAEYFSNADIGSNRVQVGLTDRNSAAWLAYGEWAPMSEVLTKRHYQVTENQQSYYPISWILTHWFFSDAQRKAQLTAYLQDIGAGGDPTEAMQRATGLSPDALERALKSYIKGRAMIQTVTYDFPVVPVTVTRLPASADALLLLDQRIKHGVTEADRASVLAQARDLAARWPGDALAEVVLARAQLESDDVAAAQETLTGLIGREPENVEALQLIAQAHLMQADVAEDLDASDRLRRQARAFLGRAYRADDADFTTLGLLAESRQGAEGYPNANDMETLRLTYALAPQLPSSRFNLAAGLIATDRRDEAVALLQPLINDPHDAGIAASARSLAELAASGASGEAFQREAEAAAEAQDDDPGGDTAPQATGS